MDFHPSINPLALCKKVRRGGAGAIFRVGPKGLSRADPDIPYVTVSDKTRHMGSVRYSRSTSSQKISKCHIHAEESFY